jgi:hypothetical protein
MSRQSCRPCSATIFPDPKEPLINAGSNFVSFFAQSEPNRFICFRGVLEKRVQRLRAINCSKTSEFAHDLLTEKQFTGQVASETFSSRSPIVTPASERLKRWEILRNGLMVIIKERRSVERSPGGASGLLSRTIAARVQISE